MFEELYDIVVVGAGPIGLYAGFRGALFLLNVRIVDKGRKWSRTYHVPKYHNIPTQIRGIAGKDLINRVRRKISVNKNKVGVDDFVRIETISKKNGLFTLKGIHTPTNLERTYISKTVVLSTGVVDKQPIIGRELKTVFPYANNQLLCYCILCDGYLAKGQNVAVLGNGTKAVLTALDLIYFKAKKVTILTCGKKLFMNKDERQDAQTLEKRLEREGIDVVADEIVSLFGIEKNLFGVKLEGGKELIFRRVFSALELFKINNDLAVMLGGKTDKTGYIIVDQDCRILDENDKPIPGLYAIGDVNQNWNQLMIGFGDAERAIIDIWANYL